MKISDNDMLLIGGGLLALYLFSQQSKKTAQSQTLGSQLGTALDKIIKPGTGAASGMTTAQGKTPTASVPDYINASANAVNALSNAVKGYFNSGGADTVIGPGNATYAPIAYDINGTPTAYGASALSERKREIPMPKALPPDAYFKGARFYN